MSQFSHKWETCLIPIGPLCFRHLAFCFCSAVSLLWPGWGLGLKMWIQWCRNEPPSETQKSVSVFAHPVFSFQSLSFLLGWNRSEIRCVATTKYLHVCFYGQSMCIFTKLGWFELQFNCSLFFSFSNTRWEMRPSLSLSVVCTSLWTISWSC